MSFRLRLCATSFAVWLSMSSASLATSPGFKILTNDHHGLGFVEGQQWFRLGIAAETFIARFGPPDNIFTANGLTAYQYYQDGFVATAKHGRVVNFSFYTHDLSHEFSPALVSSDRGPIERVSMRSLYAEFGRPTELRSSYLNKFLNYKFSRGETLAFKFENGELVHVSLFKAN